MTTSPPSATEYGRIFSSSLQPLDTTEPTHTKSSFGILDSPAFLQTTFVLKWLIENVLVQSQAGVIGGSQKSLKTSLAIELAVSLASGLPFLGKFHVPALWRVLIMSAESGGATMKKTFLRVCDSKQISDPAKLAIYWACEVPNLSDPKQLKKLHRILREHRIDVVIIDPLYLCLQGMKQASQVSNMFAMGPLLAKLTQACLRAGATPLLVHHTRKAGKDGASYPKFQRPELEDLAFSGVQQFVRQWILLGRRKAYDPEIGKHELWLSYGGSAGHSGSWGLDINEGVADSQFGGRKWAVKLLSNQDLDLKRQEEKKERKVRDHAETLEQALQEVLRVLRQSKLPLTQTDLKKQMTKGTSQLAAAVRRGLDQGLLVETKVLKAGGPGNREYDGIALAKPGGDPLSIPHSPSPAAPVEGQDQVR